MASAYRLRFDYTKLDDARKKSLKAILMILLLDGGCEIEVEPVEFPDKLQFSIDSGFTGCNFVVVWDAEKSEYHFSVDALGCFLPIMLSETYAKRLSKLLMSEIGGGVVGDVESRKYTAILDAMEDRIDPDEIERTRNAKCYKENEPVLPRDILPGMMAEIFEKTSPTRSDAVSFAKYYESRLAAHKARTAAHKARTAAHKARTAAH